MAEMNAEAFTEMVAQKFPKAKVKKVDRIEVGVKKLVREVVWLELAREDFKGFVRWLHELQHYPHVSIISGADFKERVDLNYHLTINYGKPLGELALVLTVSLPKDDLTIPTICDIIPGAIITEREIQDMFGVRVEGIPDARRIFLPPDFPADVNPWRRDAHAPPKAMIRNLAEEEAVEQ